MNATIRDTAPGAGNGMDDNGLQPRADFAPAHRTHVFKQLLKREFWEHKGGFFWAPMVAGAIFLLLAMMGIGVGEVAKSRIPDHAEVNLDGGSYRINGFDLGVLSDKMSPADLQELGRGLDVALFMSASWPLIVLAFVVFFYCLGALYDERKDRSVLFWKSLPVSDRDTVLSKVISAAVVAPLLALVAAVLTMLGFLLIASIVVLLHGGNPITLLWGPANPLRLAAQLLATLPVYAMWALPAIGWLLLCSAWARSKPFLWAVMIPLFASIFVTWFGLMQLFNLDASWFWKHIPGRLLFSVVPGSDLFYRGDAFELVADGSPDHIEQLLSIPVAYGAFLRPDMWIGAIAGVAMIFGAIRLRRWRDEG
jgi:ABC-2 type transport system permease protein